MYTLTLDFKATHQTGGLPGFPAVDVFLEPHTIVRAPAACRVLWPHLIPWNKLRRVGGLTAYLQFARVTLFVTHLELVALEGVYARGAVLGAVGPVPSAWWPPHVHVGRHEGLYTPPRG